MKKTTIIIFILILNITQLFSQENATLKKADNLIDEKENFLKALEILNGFIKNDSSSSEAYRIRGKCFRKIGELNNAEFDLKRSLLLDKNNAKTYAQLGTVYAMTNKNELALEMYNKSLQIDPNLSDAYNNRGAFYYFYLQEYDQALMDYSQAIMLNPNNDYALYNRGILYLFQEQYQKGIIDLTKSLELNPKQNKANFDRGICFYYINEYKKSIKDYNKAIKYNRTINPFERLNNGMVYYWRSFSYAEIGRTRKANKDMEKSGQTH